MKARTLALSLLAAMNAHAGEIKILPGTSVDIPASNENPKVSCTSDDSYPCKIIFRTVPGGYYTKTVYTPVIFYGAKWVEIGPDYDTRGGAQTVIVEAQQDGTCPQ